MKKPNLKKAMEYTAPTTRKALDEKIEKDRGVKLSNTLTKCCKIIKSSALNGRLTEKAVNSSCIPKEKIDNHFVEMCSRAKKVIDVANISSPFSFRHPRSK